MSDTGPRFAVAAPEFTSRVVRGLRIAGHPAPPAIRGTSSSDPWNIVGRSITMKSISLLIGLAVFWVAFPHSVEGTPNAELPLKIVSKEPGMKAPPPIPKGFPEPDPRTYRVSLRNESDKVITAWQFSCLSATNDGHHGTAGVVEDVFRAFERITEERPSGNGVLFPGAVIDLEIPGNRETLSGPYGAVACRVDAVIFADGSYAGEVTEVNRMFGKRRRDAMHARRGIELISAVLAEHGSAGGISGTVLEPLRKESSAEGNLYSDLLNKAVVAAESTDLSQSEVLTDLVNFLQEEYALIRRHLPAKQESEQ